MGDEDGKGLERAREALERWGLLLLTDARLPSLVSIVAGGQVLGSWWGHPRGGEIFRVASALEDGGDVLTARLIDGKVTFVARRLWPHLAAIGRAREDWQVRRLPAAARGLLERLDRETRVQATGPAVRELAARLLCASQEVHTELGRHATLLTTWARFARDARLGRLPAAAAARRTLEEAAAGLLPEGKPPRLPWR